MISKTQVEDFDLIVNAMQVDVFMNLVRCELKDGNEKELKKSGKFDAIMSGKKDEVQLIKEQQGLHGLADKLIKKINLMNEASSKEIRHNTNALQFSLQKAGTLDVPRPEFLDYEKRLISETGENLYLGAILNIMLAMNKSRQTEQESLLADAYSNCL
jgi:hypothetical protein